MRKRSLSTERASTHRQSNLSLILTGYLEKIILGIFIFFVLFSALAIDVKLTRYKLFAMQLSVILLLVFWIARMMLEGRIVVKSNLLNLPILFYGLAISLYYIFSRDKVVARNEFQRMLICVFVFFVVANNIRDRKNLNYILSAWLLGSIFVSLNGISSFWAVKNPANVLTSFFSWLAGIFSSLDKSLHLPVREFLGVAYYGPNQRPFATFGNPNFFAGYIIICLPIFFSMFLTERKGWRLLFGICVLFLLLNLYFTATRGAWGGFIISLAIFAILYSKQVARERWQNFWKGKLKFLIPLFLILVLHFGLMSTSQRYKKTIEAGAGKLHQIIARRTERLLIWRDTLVMGLNNPAGVGIGAFHIYFPRYASAELLKILPQDRFIVNYAHNEFLEIWSETGLIGIGIFIWTIFAFFAQGRLLLKENSGAESQKILTVGWLASSAAILAHSFVSVNMRFIITAVYFYFVLGLLASQCKREIVMPIDWPRTLKLTIIGLVFCVGILSIKEIIEPFRAHKLLTEEIGFFEEKEADPQKTIAALEETIKTNPNQALAYYRLGWVYAKEKNWGEAVRNFEIACRLNPKLVGARNNLGNIYFTLGNKQKAIENYEKAIAINPDMVDAHFNLGYCYYTVGRLKEAADEFKRVLQLDPDNYKAKIMIEKMVQ
ncbi:tetratricopeptide repeat protein [bacterium]|nr:tetratricopeptide repeat protein [bacterium]NIN93206.1 tetratricopeptide repeat protein [bacterium]NIO19003.1 tetratricopeptide repeat protein [bacterium]NIO74132.1 tetratricopeptide repeat protein [bacterium]